MDNCYFVPGCPGFCPIQHSELVKFCLFVVLIYDKFQSRDANYLVGGRRSNLGGEQKKLKRNQNKKKVLLLINILSKFVSFLFNE